jgi:ATP-binding cassette subfamily B protein
MVFLTQRLLWPLTRLGETVDLYQRAMASTNRVLDLLDTPIHVRSGDRPLPVESVRGEIRFETVTFAYGSGPPVIRDLTLHVPAKQTVAVVGSTGSGKTTLVKLILRFYEPQAGRITLDGVDLHAIRHRELRRAIGLVSQDVFLFHGTVRENIRYGSFDAADAEIEAAARAAEAHTFITRLPQGYDTIVGERGQKLSGGQRQRLSIARAVLKNPPILVLDEATSSVDNETEAAIQRSMNRIARGRTTVMIAHRLSTVRHAHCIHVLDEGRLAESGTHRELVDRDGIYAALWRVQTGEGEPVQSG